MPSRNRVHVEAFFTGVREREREEGRREIGLWEQVRTLSTGEFILPGDRPA